MPARPCLFPGECPNDSFRCDNCEIEFEKEIAYFAGLFEGEGSIGVRPYYWNKKGRHLRKTPEVYLTINMTDKEPLERITDNIGGRMTGPHRPPSMKSHWKSRWAWHLDNKEMLKYIIHLIFPYLSPRRKEKLQEVLQYLA